jgi:hypothetical protein
VSGERLSIQTLSIAALIPGLAECRLQLAVPDLALHAVSGGVSRPASTRIPDVLSCCRNPKIN